MGISADPPPALDRLRDAARSSTELVGALDELLRSRAEALAVDEADEGED